MHEQLIDQARLLATTDPRKPQQVNLRRAVSAAYYAMFHFLVDKATGYFVGGASQQRSLRHLMARGFAHGEMKSAAKAFQAGNPPDVIRRAMDHDDIPARLRQFATTFVQIQELRHRADYDLSEAFIRQAVLTEIQRVENAIKHWDEVADDPATRIFLLSVLLWDRIKRR